ncbi:MAG: FAD-dependent oxidoreductase [Deltaproteobacteria bacterium]|nr:FAD-dependent oxidoreductase [Deltaproteobacteria bacterium]MBW2152088.1 FAD-dependent oxidoreductase [Deltaproteobacteria bacterium]
MRINLLESLTDNIVIDKDKCTFCGICVERCVLDNLRMKLAPCRQACPLKVNCHGYVQAIARGQEAQGMELLRQSLPFPGIMGRICSQPCEERCYRKQKEGQAVAIRSLKRYLADMDTEADSWLPEMASGSGKKVAVVGAGPSGMMASYELRVKGHEVSLFERESAPGGMLRWAIPEFRLPVKVLNKELELLKRMGIQIECGVSIGKDKDLEELKREFHAIIIATGCVRHLTLNVQGEDLQGVYHGLPFLKEIRKGKSPEVGKKAVVIGGGNVAVDAAQSALRLGAQEVTMVALESDETLPAFSWAVESAVSEGIKLECSWGNPKFLSSHGRLTGIEFQRCVQVFDESGCFMPRFDDCQLNHLEADTAIVAIGQRADTELLEILKLAQPGKVSYEPLTLQTSEEMIFIAGDLATGPGSVVEAMAMGRQAAESVDRFLKKENLRYGREYPGAVETEFEIDTEKALEQDRVRIAQHRYAGMGDFREIEKGLDQKSARLEASRCYSCGQPFGKYRTCWFCLPCEVDCPHDALWVDIPYLLR